MGMIYKYRYILFTHTHIYIYDISIVSPTATGVVYKRRLPGAQWDHADGTALGVSCDLVGKHHQWVDFDDICAYHVYIYIYMRYIDICTYICDYICMYVCVHLSRYLIYLSFNPCNYPCIIMFPYTNLSIDLSMHLLYLIYT